MHLTVHCNAGHGREVDRTGSPSTHVPDGEQVWVPRLTRQRGALCATARGVALYSQVQSGWLNLRTALGAVLLREGHTAEAPPGRGDEVALLRKFGRQEPSRLLQPYGRDVDPLMEPR